MLPPGGEFPATRTTWLSVGTARQGSLMAGLQEGGRREGGREWRKGGREGGREGKYRMKPLIKSESDLIQMT